MPKYILGLDVGATKIQAGLVNNMNKVVSSRQFKLNGKNKSTILGSIFSSLEAFFNPEVKSIGVGITGLVMPKSNLVIQSPNLPKSWHRIPLKLIIQKKYQRPVTIDNDAHAIALAEAIIGQGKKHSIILSLTLGTGLGAGLVINKNIYRGSMGAIEFGHIIVDGQLSRQHGQRAGHLEYFVSGKGLVRLYKKYSNKNASSFDIIKLSQRGDKAATKAIKELSHWLAIAIANAIHSYNPDVIILGGGLAKVKEIIRPALRQIKPKLVFPELNKTKIVVSSLGYQAGVIGAALLTKKY